MIFSSILSTFPFNCFFLCSTRVKRLLGPFKFLSLFDGFRKLVMKFCTAYQTYFIANKNSISQCFRFTKNYCFFSKLLPYVSSCFLRNCCLTIMIFLSGLFSLSISLWESLSCLLDIPTSLCVCSLFLSLAVYLSSISLFLAISDYLFLLSLCLILLFYSISEPLFLFFSPHTLLVTSSISSLINTLSCHLKQYVDLPLSLRSQVINTQELFFAPLISQKRSPSKNWENIVEKLRCKPWRGEYQSTKSNKMETRDYLLHLALWLVYW